MRFNEGFERDKDVIFLATENGWKVFETGFIINVEKIKDNVFDKQLEIAVCNMTKKEIYENLEDIHYALGELLQEQRFIDELKIDEKIEEE